MSQLHIPAVASKTPDEAARPRQSSSIPLRIFAVCITSALVAVNYTNYGPLIPALRSELHISNGQAGLFSTLLFLGLAVTYIPGGMLADRYGSRPVLLGSSILFVFGELLLPLFPNLTWMLICRAILGFGSGAAFVAGVGGVVRPGRHAHPRHAVCGGAVHVGSRGGRQSISLLVA